jgi:hypothetical protein
MKCVFRIRKSGDGVKNPAIFVKKQVFRTLLCYFLVHYRVRIGGGGVQ